MNFFQVFGIGILACATFYFVNTLIAIMHAFVKMKINEKRKDDEEQPETKQEDGYKINASIGIDELLKILGPPEEEKKEEPIEIEEVNLPQNLEVVESIESLDW